MRTFERINAFNLRDFRPVLPRRYLIAAETEGIPEKSGDVWLGCRGEDGSPVGCIIARREMGTARSFLEFVFVRRDVRRQGVASALLDNLIDCCGKDVTELRCLRRPPDTAGEIFEAWCLKNGFERKIWRERFVCEAKRILPLFENGSLPGFDIVPLEGELTDGSAIAERQRRTSGRLRELLFDTTPETAAEIRRLRNEMVFVPQGERYRIVERATGREAGFFSFEVWNDCLHLNSLSIHPEFRPRLYLWKNAAAFVARAAVERNLKMSWIVLFWRPEFVRQIVMYFTGRGLLVRQPYYAYRRALTAGK